MGRALRAPRAEVEDRRKFRGRRGRRGGGLLRLRSHRRLLVAPGKAATSKGPRQFQVMRIEDGWRRGLRLFVCVTINFPPGRLSPDKLQRRRSPLDMSRHPSKSLGLVSTLRRTATSPTSSPESCCSKLEAGPWRQADCMICLSGGHQRVSSILVIEVL